MTSYTSRASIVVVCLVVIAAATPVRRSPDLEARRRSAIDRNLVRFGRSYPPEPSAADMREAFQRSTRKGNNFLRFGRSQTVNIPTEDLYALLKNYEEDYETPKRSASFIRFGRDPGFVRFGRSGDERIVPEQSSELVVSGTPQRKNRARDHFLRLGRDSEENEGNEYEPELVENRRKRSSVADCHDCQS